MRGRDGAKLSRVAGGKASGRVDEERLLRGRNKTMLFLERCRRRRLAAVLLPSSRKEKEAEWLLETESPD